MENATESIAAYSIYYRVVLFGFQPVIAASVAMLPYAARRFGEGDRRGVRCGLRDAVVASTLYSLIIVGPLMLWLAPWIARQLAETPLTIEYTTFALRMVPLACLTSVLFILCRPVFEAMNRGRPGLVIAVLRYLVLTGPLAWLGMLAARGMGQPPLYGLIAGLLVAGTASSVVFYAWLRSTLREVTGPGERPAETCPPS
jgi:Na+-driven multidrug efflux pump